MHVCRVKPDGTRTLFATLPALSGWGPAAPESVAYCGGSLWVVADGCYKITPKK